MADIDFGRHSDDYSNYRPGFPDAFYRRLDAVRPVDGMRVLDLATGPGTIALELAARGASVVGLDVAPEQVEEAKREAREQGLGRAEFAVGRAEDTGCEERTFDLVTAGHCWHWFDSAAVLSEARRVLRSDGLLAIAYYSYLAEHSAVARDTEDLVLRLNPAWTMAGASGQYPELVDELVRSGYRLVEQFCFDCGEEFSHDRWRGRMRTCNGVGSGGLPPADVERFDEQLALLLRERYPEPMVVEYRAWCAVASPTPPRD